MIKNNRMSPAWGRNAQKWGEMEKAVEEGWGELFSDKSGY